ncbi:MAG: DegV family protein, partial [Oscillospiraceae bacterium]|nr:DegV family protein [Oscillospiraceae bacterium]
MAVRIITDSSCDQPFSIQKDWNIDILPFHIFFGDDEYVDGQNLDRQKFYKLMSKSPILPKTAQVTTYEFEEVFKPYVEAGDEILVLPISKEMSGTHNSALLAKELYPDASIYVVDTLNVTFGLALLVEVAVKLRDEGLDAKSIAEKIEKLKKRVRLYAVIGDLKYLKLGGRLSSAGAAVGTLLNIKPIISVCDGKVVG